MADVELSIKRIMVALDASPSSFSTMENAVELASQLKAELTGLFVEDIDLLRVTELPFVQEIGVIPPFFRQFDLQQLERQFRSQANQMRKALASAADSKGVTWSFKVARGAVASEVLTAGIEADLVIMGRAGRSLAGPRYLGSTVRIVILQRKGLTLIMQRQLRLETAPAMLVYDGSALSKKALKAAMSLVQIRDGRLVVFLLADSQASADHLQEDARNELHAEGLHAHFHTLINPRLSWLANTVQSESRGPLILPCEKGLVNGEDLCSLIHEIQNPVLLVR